MTFIKKFTDDGHGGHIAGKKVYYFEDKPYTYSLKEYDIKSSKTRTVKTMKKSGRYELYYSGKMADSYAVFFNNKGQYKITYKTGKITKVPR